MRYKNNNKNKYLKTLKMGGRQLRHSQNFLQKSKLIAKLIDNSSVGNNDVVYEIGPGRGIITCQLAKHCARLIAVEYDRNLFEKLNQMFACKKNIEIVFADFLKMELPLKENYKVFSNIPFNLTADILAKLTLAPNPPKDSYLIIQEEAAEKYAGSPYNKERFSSLIIKPYFELTILHRFQRADFFPVPRVNIVLLRIKKRDKPLIITEEVKKYNDFIAYAFIQHGKNLKERIKKIFTNEQFRRQSQTLRFILSAKPGDLDFRQWLCLFKYFFQKISLDKQSLIRGSYFRLISQQKKLDKIHRTREL